MAVNLQNGALGSGAPGAGTGTDAANIESLIQTQYQSGLQLAQIQSWSGVVKNWTTALQGVARNIAP